MEDISHIIGSNPFGVSKFQRSWLTSYATAIFQKARAVTDSEGNLMSQISMHEIERTWQTFGGAGLVRQLIPANGPSANVARIHDGTITIHALVGGALLQVRGTTDLATIDVACPAPPGTGTRTDLIYLEVWAEEIQPTISPESASSTVYNRGNTNNATPLTNDLVVIAATETARRVQIRYAIKVASGVSTLANLPVGGYIYSAGPVVGQYRAGDGSINAGTSLNTADGYKHAIPLATVARTAGVTTINAVALTLQARLVLLGFNSDRVDLFHASSTPAANTLLPLDGAGKYPSGVFTGLAGSATDVDKVDTFDASSTPTANTLLPLNGSIKYPLSVLRTGAGNGIDADKVDTFDVVASPALNKLLALDGTSKYPNSALRTGSGQGLNLDSVDGFHVFASPAANTLLPLDGTSKYPNSALRTGSGQGLDADKVDGFEANPTPGANRLLPLDASIKFPNAALRTGSGQGLDADKVDGLHASGLALDEHSPGYVYNAQRQSSIIALPITFSGSIITQSYDFPAGKSIGIMAWYFLRGTYTVYSPGVFNPTFFTLQISENGPGGESVIYDVALNQNTIQPPSGTIFYVAVPLFCQASISNTANHFNIYGLVSTSGSTITYSRLHLLAWYL